MSDVQNALSGFALRTYLDLETQKINQDIDFTNWGIWPILNAPAPQGGQGWREGGSGFCTEIFEGDKKIMETELMGIVLGAVLPLYPLLIAIYQKTGRYDEIVEEFKKLRDEHEQVKEAYHG